MVAAIAAMGMWLCRWNERMMDTFAHLQECEVIFAHLKKNIFVFAHLKRCNLNFVHSPILKFTLRTFEVGEFKFAYLKIGKLTLHI